ncbi:MAG: T9SS type A sorting domain-containing protein, partial [Saprospiraceae bacterium]|nr:T9SS type A sorting domain-containing protein [Saprospiraceae bacterium]
EVNDAKEVMLFNSIGQAVHTYHLDRSEVAFKMNTADLQPGIYFVTVRAGDRFFTRKLVK